MNFYHIFGTIVALLVVSSEGYPRTVLYRSYNGNYNDENCEIKSHGLKTIQDVQAAIENAKDGEIIRLDPIEYEGDLQILNKNNHKYISIVGSNQCHKNTIIRGKIEIRANNWIINAIVFKDSEKAIDVKKCVNIKLMNLVINHMTGNAIDIHESEEVSVDNLVVENIGNNAVDVRYTTQIRVRNAVISNVGGVALKFEDCYKIQLLNNVARNVVGEVIKVTGQSSNVRIAQTVINGDSPKGQGWMWLEGDFYEITNTVATGAPRNGIVVNGCNCRFSGNICTQGGRGYCIYLNNKESNCHNSVGFTNMNIGGYGLVNNH